MTKHTTTPNKAPTMQTKTTMARFTELSSSEGAGFSAAPFEKLNSSG
jgi:hypothetical protein